MEEYQIDKLLEFIERDSSIFSKYEKDYLMSYIIGGQYSKILFLPDLVREVVDELGFLLPEQDIYAGFIELIKESFDLREKEIVEIGGGILPRVGERLSKLDEVRCVTVYDPRISKNKIGNDKLKLVRRNVVANEDDIGGDLLVGFMPCKGAEVIVRQALKYNHDFIVALCEGGLHGDIYDYFDNEDEWICSLIREAELGIEKNNMGTLKIKTLEKYGDKYPIICNDRVGD